MQIARAMTGKMVFNSVRIACADLKIIMYDRVVVFFPYHLFHILQPMETCVRFGGALSLADTGKQGDPLVLYVTVSPV